MSSPLHLWEWNSTGGWFCFISVSQNGGHRLGTTHFCRPWWMKWAPGIGVLLCWRKQTPCSGGTWVVSVVRETTLRAHWPRYSEERVATSQDIWGFWKGKENDSNLRSGQTDTMRHDEWSYLPVIHTVHTTFTPVSIYWHSDTDLCFITEAYTYILNMLFVSVSLCSCVHLNSDLYTHTHAHVHCNI